MSNRKSRRILAAFRLAYSSNRKILSGIARYVKRNRNWRVEVANQFQDFTAALSETVVREGYDGVMTVPPDGDEARRILTALPVPVAFLGAERTDIRGRRAPSVFVNGDDEEYGRLAARHFLSLGRFASYGYLDIRERRAWSKSRLKGFSDELARRGAKVVRIRSPFPSGSSDDLQRIRHVLAEMPKPAALFAAYDNRALNALDVCRTPELEVPRQVSVIGVDDDEVLCDFSAPTLTSLATDGERKGEAAAEALERVLARRERRTTCAVTISGAKVVERESTAPVVPAAHLIERALRYIAENACVGIRARDVAAALGVSRALADRRFREYADTTILSEINKVRLAKLKRLLRESRLSAAKAAALCGFPEPNYARRFFKRETGLTMVEFRASANGNRSAYSTSST